MNDEDSGSFSEEGGFYEEEDEEDMSWIRWFCSQKGSEYFCEVAEDYIEDDFNLISLAAQVPFYRHALHVILDLEPIGRISPEQTHRVVGAAELLYGLIHARYIITSQGLHACIDKYRSKDYGTCPRVYCNKQAVIPVGLTDVPDTNTVKLFCPSCRDIYTPRSPRHARIDGAFFGTTFPHLFFHTYPLLGPRVPPRKYVPRIFGFKIRRQDDGTRNVLTQSPDNILEEVTSGGSVIRLPPSLPESSHATPTASKTQSSTATTAAQSTTATASSTQSHAPSQTATSQAANSANSARKPNPNSKQVKDGSEHSAPARKPNGKHNTEKTEKQGDSGEPEHKFVALKRAPTPNVPRPAGARKHPEIDVAGRLKGSLTLD